MNRRIQNRGMYHSQKKRTRILGFQNVGTIPWDFVIFLREFQWILKGYFWQDFMDFDRDFDSISKGILNILREISRILVIL